MVSSENEKSFREFFFSFRFIFTFCSLEKKAKHLCENFTKKIMRKFREKMEIK